MGSIARTRDRERIARLRDGRRRHVLAVLSDLWQHRDRIDLNRVDGEFYFRCCKDGFDKRLQQIRGIPRDNADDLFNAARDLLVDFRLPLEVAYDHVLNGKALRLRDPQLRPQISAEGREEAIQLRVHDAAWTGADVAHYIEQRYRPGSLAWLTSDENLSIPTTTAAEIGVTFSLMNANSLSNDIRGLQDDGYELWGPVKSLGLPGTTMQKRGPIGPPHVLVHISLPLPPSSVVAALYDAGVCGQQGWQSLVAQATGQQPDVAMRTWTIALLVKNGLNFGQAVWKWREATESPHNDISKARFYDDRDHLFTRVPEAKRSLVSRKQRQRG